MSTSNTNRGYAIPDKGKGRLSLEGRDLFLTCSWTGADKQQITLSGKDAGTGQGMLKLNERKTNPNQPDWRGEWTDAGQRKWLLSAWNKDKDGERLLSLSLTDPATLSQRTGASAPAGAPAPAASHAPAPARPVPPPSDPNAQGPIASTEFDDLTFSDPFNPGGGG